MVSVLLKMIKPLWLLSLLGVLAANIVAYAFFPTTVDIYLFAGELPIFFEKDTLFYLVIGVVLFVNVLFNALGKNLYLLPKPLIFVPNKQKWLEKPNQKALFRRMKEWTRALALVMNLLMAALIGNIYASNSEVPGKAAWTFYVVLGLFILWLVTYWPFFRFVEEDD